MKVKANIFQQRFWLEWNLHKRSSSYNTPLIFNVTGKLCMQALSSALDHFVNKHDLGCRSVFEENTDVVYQVILPKVEVKLGQIDVGKAQLDRVIHSLIRHQFNLVTGPLFKFDLINVDDGTKVLVLNFHHIISDAKSAHFLVQAIKNLYLHYYSGTAIDLISESKASYFSEELSTYQIESQHTKYWYDRLCNYPLSIELPIQQVEDKLSTSNVIYFEIDRDIHKSLQSFCRQNRCTPFITIASIFAVLLSFYTKQEKLILNYPLDSRNQHDKESLGCFVNNLVLLFDIKKRTTISEIIESVKAQRKLTKSNNQTTLLEVMKLFKSRGSNLAEPFNISIIEAYFDDKPINLADADLIPVQPESRDIADDLIMAYHPDKESVRFRLEYNNTKFCKEFIISLSEHYRILLPLILLDSDNTIECLKRESIKRLSNRLNDILHEKNSPISIVTVLELFSKTAIANANNVAVVCANYKLTYQELESQSNYLADIISDSVSQTTDNKDPIGVLLNRNLYLPVVLLAILKSGHAYIPIDPNTSKKRLKSLVTGHKIQAIITTSNHLDLVNELAIQHLAVDQLQLKDRYPQMKHRLCIKGDDLAYILFTSGTTGQPKGVMIEHQSLANLISYFINKLGTLSAERVVSLTNYVFDIFGLELYLPLLIGGTLYLLTENQISDVKNLNSLLTKIKPTLIQATPSHWRLIMISGWHSKTRRLTAITGGEALTVPIASYLLDNSSNCYQVYGPTETTIWSTIYKLDSKFDYNIIGQPIDNTSTYVLDEHGQPQPPYATGILHIEGIGLARGYYNDPQQTQQYFTHYVTSDGSVKRIYNTGDIVYQVGTGELVYIGRSDQQVKIRGHRVECSYIEAKISELANISQAVVKSEMINDEASLVAFIIFNNGDNKAIQALKLELKQLLPDYMVPNKVVVLKEFPLTSSGKIDRRLLTTAHVKSNNQQGEVTDSNKLEDALLRIWQQTFVNDDITLDDDFFELGGHSIIAAKLIMSLEKILGLGISIGDIRNNPTVRAMARLFENSEITQSRVLYYDNLDKINIAPLSYQQSEIYFALKRNDASSDRYNIVVAQSIGGDLNIKALNDAINILVARHGSLRIRISDYDSGNPTQEILPYKPIDLDMKDLNAKDLNSELAAAASYRFGVNDTYLFKFLLCKFSNNQYLLIFNIHHLLIDGWSLDILQNDLAKYYRAFANGSPIEKDIVVKHPTYLDYARLQNSFINSPAYEENVYYWSKVLADIEGYKLPLDGIKQQTPDYNSKHVPILLSSELSSTLYAFAKQRKTTIFNVLLAALSIVIHKYTSTNDLLFWIPIANRNKAEYRNLVGLMTHLIPIKVMLSDKIYIHEILEQIQSYLDGATDHQDITAYDINCILNSNNKINDGTQFVLAFQNANDNYNIKLEGLNCQYIPVQTQASAYELFLNLRDNDGTIEGTLSYQTSLYTDSSIKILSNYLVEILEKISTASDLQSIKLSTKSITSAMYHDPLRKTKFPADLSIVDIFKQQARINSSNIALSYNKNLMTYQRLDEESDKLAGYIRGFYKSQYQHDMPIDTFIGLCLDRSCNLIIAILAILKAGGIYVPCDPRSPPGRIKYIFDDCQIKLLVTSKTLRDLFDAQSAWYNKAIFIEDDIRDYTAGINMTSPDQHAYVIYTSGTTGHPKGTLIKHNNVMRLLKATDKLFNFTPDDVWTLFHNCAFDFSVWEIFGALLHGSKLVIVPHDTARNCIAFRELLINESITVLNQTPSAFLQLITIENDFFQQNPLKLKYVIFGGESLKLASLEQWWQMYPDTPQLINMYGITETTVHVTYKRLYKADLKFLNLNNIGRPLEDLRAYVIDSSGDTCPAGIPGELYIAGDGLATGYLNRNDLTDKAFVTGSSLGLDEKRLYKTGDRVRWLSNGELSYLGRIDNQIKLRGYRIQLEEIYYAIKQLDMIIDCEVLFHNVHNALVAYIIANSKFDKNALHNQLSKELPDYMIPKYYVRLNKFPLTTNGKLDKNNLLTLDVEVFSNNYESPVTDEEKILAAQCRKILKLKSVGRNDNYFAIGGDSMHVLRLINGLNNHGYTIKTTDVFKHPILKEMAKFISKTNVFDTSTNRNIPFDMVSKDLKDYFGHKYQDLYPLTRLQQGMIFHSEMTLESSQYIDLISCTVQGPFVKELLEELLRELANTHPILRTELVDWRGKYLQGIKQNASIDIDVIDLRDLNQDDQQGTLQKNLESNRLRKFKLIQSSLWRISIHLFSENSFNFALICHHAILDGWSVALFFKEIFLNYNLRLAGHYKKLSKPSIEYRDFVSNEIKVTNNHDHRSFWTKLIGYAKPCPFGQSDTLGVASLDQQSRTKHTLTPTQASLLRNISAQHGLGTDTILLAIHLFAMSTTIGKLDITTGLTVNARLEQGSTDQMLGLFLNVLPISCKLDDTKLWIDWIQAVHAIKIECLEHKAYPLAEILRLVNHDSLFDVIFNYVDFHVFEEIRNLDNLHIEPSFCYENTNYNMLVQAGIDQSTMQVVLEFICHQQSVDHNKVNLYINIFKMALNSLLNDTKSSLFTNEYQRQLATFYPLAAWNDTKKDITQYDSLFKLFLNEAQKNIASTALIEGDTRITYEELLIEVSARHSYLNQYFDKSKRKQLASNPYIIICIPRSINAVIASLAIISLGASYVPVDPTHPRNRLEYYIEDSQAPLILIDELSLQQQPWLQEIYEDKLIIWERMVKTMNTDVNELWDVSHTRNQPAYMMYTSGSTGNPKGVVVDQVGIIRLVKNTNYIDIKPDDKIAHTSNVSFDVSTFEIWGALLNGATLVVIPQDVLLDAFTLETTLKQEKVTIMWLTARLFDTLVMTGTETIFSNIDSLLVGGDILSKEWVSVVLKNKTYRPKRLVNGYGPTENTSFTTTHDITDASLNLESIPIGKPIANTRTYVLDDELNILPIGCVGELYSAGLGLARGYHNADEKTRSKFIKHLLFDPITHRFIHERLYKTGDLARWLPNGELEFLGRIDRTIKMSGYQVNLDKVEATINKQPGIKTCRILILEANGKKMICYYVPNGSVDIQSLKHRLYSTLPNYMIPNQFIELENLPLTKNGKVNDSSLPRPDSLQQNEEIGESIELETKLTIAWKQVLGHDQFNINDKFFNVGGNSMLAMELHWKIKSQITKKITIVDIFRYPTIQSMIEHLTTNNDVEVNTKSFKDTESSSQKVKSLKDRLKRLVTE